MEATGVSSGATKSATTTDRESLWQVGAAWGLYIAALFLSHGLATALDARTGIWAQAGVALAGFMSISWRLWWIYGLGIVTSSLMVGLWMSEGALAGTALGLGDVAVGIGGCLLLRHLKVQGEVLDELTSLVAFLSVAVVSALVSATLMDAISTTIGGARLGESWGVRCAAVALGIVLIAPLGIAVILRPTAIRRWCPTTNFIILALVVIAITVIVYLGYPGRSAAATSAPILIWVAMRSSTMEVAGLLAAISLVELSLAAAGYGPTDPDGRRTWICYRCKPF